MHLKLEKGIKQILQGIYIDISILVKKEKSLGKTII